MTAEGVYKVYKVLKPYTIFSCLQRYSESTTWT